MAGFSEHSIDISDDNNTEDILFEMFKRRSENMRGVLLGVSIPRIGNNFATLKTSEYVFSQLEKLGAQVDRKGIEYEGCQIFQIIMPRPLADMFTSKLTMSSGFMAHGGSGLGGQFGPPVTEDRTTLIATQYEESVKEIHRIEKREERKKNKYRNKEKRRVNKHDKKIGNKTAICIPKSHHTRHR